jgi:hypothetical protein
MERPNKHRLSQDHGVGVCAFSFRLLVYVTIKKWVKWAQFAEWADGLQLGQWDDCSCGLLYIQTPTVAAWCCKSDTVAAVDVAPNWPGQIRVTAAWVLFTSYCSTAKHCAPVFSSIMRILRSFIDLNIRARDT